MIDFDNAYHFAIVKIVGVTFFEEQSLYNYLYVWILISDKIRELKLYSLQERDIGFSLNLKGNVLTFFVFSI